MTCPNCNKTVKDGTDICPHCDFIIDASFLGDAGDPESAEPTLPPARPAPRKPAPRPASKPATRPAPSRTAAREANEDGSEVAYDLGKAARASQNRWAKYAEDAAEGEPPRPPPPKPKLTADGKPDLLGDARAVPVGDQLESMVQQFKSLIFEDKLTVVSAAATVIMTFMPWRTTAADGDSLGVFSISGLACIAFAVAGAAAVIGRIGNYIPALPRTSFPVVTMSLGGLIVITAIATGLSSIDRTRVQSPIGAMVVSNSMPSFGVWLTVFTAAGLILGGFLTFKRLKAEGA